MSEKSAHRTEPAPTSSDAAPTEPAPTSSDAAPTDTAEATDVARMVPVGLRLSAAFAWRLLIVAAAIGVIIWLIGELALVTTTLAVALLLAALMAPVVDLLIRKVRLPRGLAVAVTLVGGLALLTGLVTFVVVQFTDGLPALREQLNRSFDQVERWLSEGPFGLGTADINNLVGQVVSYVQQNQGTITTSALTTAGAVGEFLTGFLLTLFILIFFLLHGEQIWSFLVKAVPGEARRQADVAGRRGFASLVSYVRATAVVAVVDAVGIGIGLWILGVPLVVPLATLVFLGAFIPIIGAVLTGAIAVLVALVTVGWIKALIALAVVIAVMQLESHVLQPLLLGRAVKIHPLAVILAITAGLVIAGITGALVSVPLVAVINAGAKSLISDDEAQSGADVPMLARGGSAPDAVKEPSEDGHDAVRDTE